MSFLLPLDLADPEVRPGLQMAEKGARTSGTPFISFFMPEEMMALDREAGFREVRHVFQERTYKVGSYSNPVPVRHYIVDADIVKGNSGGPVLDESNRVIGIAVKGLDAPGTVHENDQLSSFVPVNPSSLPPLIPST